MRTKEIVDFNRVDPAHDQIHERLINWARWVSVKPHCWPSPSMWRKALTSKQWDTSPHIPIPVNTLDAADVEKAVSRLPEKQREAIRWSYVYQRDPAGAAKTLAVSKQGLCDLISTGRTMLKNRLQS